MRRRRSFRAWEWKRGHWLVILHAWPISRPRLSAFWLNERELSVALSWGTPGVDPVWLVEFHASVPEPLGRLVDRWYAWRYPRRPSS